MNRSKLPSGAFIDPRGTNRGEVRRLAERFLDLALSQASTAIERPPLPELTADLRLREVPEQGRSEEEMLSDLKHLLDHSMNAAHPGYVGYMNSMPTTASVLGDLVAAAVDNNMLSLELSPAFSYLENHLIRQFAADFGLGEKGAGVLVGGGSVANLQALTIARNKVFDEALTQGLVGRGQRPVILASEAAHTSLQKAAMILGLGTTAVVGVAVDQDSRMDVQELERRIAEARAAGCEPFCVVATAGTTVTGNIDPLNEIHRVTKEHGLWLHVDAAYGGALTYSDRHQARLAGIEHADSVTFDPHKWLYVARNCAMVLLRDAGLLEEVFRVPAPYMSVAGGLTNVGEISVHGTNHTDVVKLWLSLEHLGREGYAQLIDESYRLTDVFSAAVEERSFLELASRPEMNIICFRCTPNWLPEKDWDEWNVRLKQHVFSECDTFLSIPSYHGTRWLRANPLNPYLDEDLIDRVFAVIDRAVEKRTWS